MGAESWVLLVILWEDGTRIPNLGLVWICIMLVVVKPPFRSFGDPFFVAILARPRP